MKPAKYFHRQCDGFGREKTAPKNGLSQMGDLSVIMDFSQAVRGKAGNFEADRIGSDVNRGKSRHSTNSVQPRSVARAPRPRCPEFSYLYRSMEESPDLHLWSQPPGTERIHGLRLRPRSGSPNRFRLLYAVLLQAPWSSVFRKSLQSHRAVR